MMAPGARRETLLLWYEPWAGAHGDWLARDAAPPGWDRIAGMHPLAQRLAYRLWCAHFGIPSQLGPPATGAATGWPLEGPAPAWFGAPAWRCENWATAGLFIGMVAAVSRPDVLRRWPQQGRRHGTWAHEGLWRRASQMARARPLDFDGEVDVVRAGMEDGDALMAFGWNCMRALCEQWWPAGWSRLMFRCSRRVLRRSEALEPSRPCLPLRPSHLRAVSRVWAASLRLNHEVQPDSPKRPGALEDSLKEERWANDENDQL